MDSDKCQQAAGNLIGQYSSKFKCLGSIRANGVKARRLETQLKAEGGIHSHPSWVQLHRDILCS